MLRSANIAAPCCSTARWDVLTSHNGVQVWALFCPEHGRQVGSEQGLRYSPRDATSNQEALGRRTAS